MSEGFESIDQICERWQRETPRQRARSRASSLSPAGIRQKRSRARRRNGRVLLRVEVDEFKLIEALQTAGRLTGEQGLQRTAVEREVADLIADWAKRWMRATE